MKKILFQGDSITDWFRSKERDDVLGSNYATMVSGELGLKFPNKYEFVNRGVSGNRSIDILARTQKDIITLKPDYMSVLVGINDVWHGFDWNNGVSAKNYQIYYNMLISEVKENLPNIKIMIMEPFVLDGTVTENRWQIFRNEVELRAELSREIAQKHNLVFVPLQKQFDEATEKAPVEYWLYDGVHPTAAGHQIIKNAWIDAFSSLLG